MIGQSIHKVAAHALGDLTEQISRLLTELRIGLRHLRDGFLNSRHRFAELLQHIPRTDPAHIARFCQDNKKPTVNTAGLLCGAKGIRTPDPLHAMEMRYQLRYSPE